MRVSTTSAFLFGLFLHVIGMTWMAKIGVAPYLMLSVFEGFGFAIAGGIAGWLLPRLPVWARPVAFAALWVLLEFGRYAGKMAFPWFLLSATQAQADALPFVQICAFTGHWGLTFAIALVCGLIAEAWLARGNRPVVLKCLGTVFGLVLCLYYFGRCDMPGFKGELGPDDSNRVETVGVVQGNFRKLEYNDPVYCEEVLNTYLDLSRTVAKDEQLAFVLWPETVTPGYLLFDHDMYRKVTALAREIHTPLLIGTPDMNRRTRDHFNTAIHFDANGVQRDRYDKQRLVPIGEFLVFREQLWSLYEKYGAGTSDTVPGTEDGVFPVGDTTVGMLICYESVFPEISRKRVREGAQVLVQLTSDQTFDDTSNPQQHAQYAILRAVETRRYFVRAGATGLSEIIDTAGRVRVKIPENIQGADKGTIVLQSGETFYVRHGDWFVYLCAAGLLVAAAINRRPLAKS